ncbi:phage tail tape measure protein [Candidatus Pacearchaeota archaeon]|nr:phage tail tape measure protein [Candidatus Pacearchaeota archaeon]
MANFSSGGVLLSAVVEIRVKEESLRKDLAKAKRAVQETTDRMTKESISKMKDKARASLRINKLEQQQTVRSVQDRIAAQGVLRREAAKTLSDERKALTQRKSHAREVARTQREAVHRLGRMSSAFRMLGVQVTIAGAIITAVFVKMLSQFTDFDRSMRKATAVTTFNLQQYTRMSDMAEQASISLNMAATNTADAFYFLGSAGLSATDQMKAFLPVVTLAKAAVIEAGQAAEIMVDTMKGFKIPFEETAHVAAVMAKSVISSNMNFLQLGETLSLVAGVARSTNNTLEETAAMIQLMANVGIKGTRAGTTMRRSMINLAAPSEKIKRLFRDMSIEIEDQSGKIKPYIQLIGEISDALTHATESQKQMAFKTLFGARAIAGQIELFSAGSAELKNMTMQLILAGNTHEEIAQKQLKAFGEEVGQMRKQFENLSRYISSKFVPTLKMASAWMKNFAEEATNASEKNETLMGVLTGTGLAMGGILTMAGTGLTTLASLALVASGLNMSFLALTGIILGAVAAITAIVATIVFLVNKVAKARDEQIKFNDSIRENKKLVDGAREANEKWIESLGRMLPSDKMIKIQKGIRDVADELERRSTSLEQFGALSENLDAVSAGSLSFLLKERGLSTPLARPKMGVFSQPGMGGAPSEMPLMDKKAAMESIIEFEKWQIKRHKATIKVLIDQAGKAFEDRRNQTGEEKGFENIWRTETLEAVVGMYSDMRGEASNFFKFSKQLAERRRQDMLKDFQEREFVSDTERASELKKFEDIQEAHKIQMMEQLRFEKAIRSGSFIEGLREGMKKISRDFKTAGQHGVEMASTIESSMGTAFERIISEGGNFRDAMLGFANEIQNAFIEVLAGRIAAGVMGNISMPTFMGMSGGGRIQAGGAPAISAQGVGVAHRGGLMTPANIANLPRFHKGLAADEFPAILQTGERVIPRGGGSASQQPNIVINFEDKTSQGVAPTQSRTEFDGKSFVTNIILEDSVNFGPLKSQGIIR